MKKLSEKKKWDRVTEYLVAGGRLRDGLQYGGRSHMRLPSRYAVVNAARVMMGDVLHDEAMRLADLGGDQ